MTITGIINQTDCLKFNKTDISWEKHVSNLGLGRYFNQSLKSPEANSIEGYHYYFLSCSNVIQH